MNLSDKRIHHRVQCFNYPFEHDYIPMWVFTANHGVAALVVNLSFSGIQLLTESDEPLLHPKYNLVFINEADHEQSIHTSCQINLVWNDKSSSFYNTSGFTFDGNVENIIKTQLKKFHHGMQPYLRCELQETSQYILN
ncbi:hypothetical protein [Sapientia aquatica]|uniref:PilZ domain-containing protein n=1 Tax=Sapientia aquatica TaxID=1549640 RepID=A0A4R5W6A0_9BURK|nr:hypothetical protein [Sapientia aquatica]TDK68619.1 hypothetical protein E2I14_03510 [Sapientia aquatica]